ncbi:MAG: xanthine phosphoribosyltransferase, partial [Clostridia bacterium]
FQPGRSRLEAAGYKPVSLASIAWMDEGQIEFTKEVSEQGADHANN